MILSSTSSNYLSSTPKTIGGEGLNGLDNIDGDYDRNFSRLLSAYGVFFPPCLMRWVLMLMWIYGRGPKPPSMFILLPIFQITLQIRLI